MEVEWLLVLLEQIGAYDQQVWEKSLEQAELNVRTRHLSEEAKHSLCFASA